MIKGSVLVSLQMMDWSYDDIILKLERRFAIRQKYVPDVLLDLWGMAERNWPRWSGRRYAPLVCVWVTCRIHCPQQYNHWNRDTGRNHHVPDDGIHYFG